MNKILLLDDNPLVGRLWAGLLARDGFEVIVVHELGEAIEALDRDKPQLMMIDSALPEMDGFELCGKILRERKGAAPQVVILSTNIDTTVERTQAEMAGARDLWLKYELKPGELVRRIQTILGLPCPGDHVSQEVSFGDALVLAGIVSETDFFRALKLQLDERICLDEALLKVNAIAPENLKLLRELLFRADYVDLSVYKPEQQAIEKVPEEISVRFKVFPLAVDEGALSLVMADPRDVEAIDYVGQLTGLKIRPFYAPLEEVQKAQLLFYGARELREKEAQKKPAEKQGDIVMGGATIAELLSERPVVEMVDVALLKAMEVGASDLHIEPSEETLRLRFRLDGILHEMYTLPAAVAKPLVTRIKILSSLNIAESRLPQDGRFQMKFPEGVIDYRVSIIPVADGEKVVIRVLDRRATLKSLENLGFEPDRLGIYKKMMKRPYGMILITGPTGSGKTTTLYATLNWLKTPQINVVSIEDPVEFRLDGVNQIHVNPKIGLTFASILRNVLRQDPNIIMVGEIRDLETAELAVQAALTGHLVLGTLHTNDAPTGLVRLVDMGMPAYMVNATVNGIVSQRLMRRICKDCRAEYDFEEAGGERALPDELKGVRLFHGKGCHACRGTGYRGRVAIYELMPVTRALRAALLEKKDGDLLSRQARTEGMLTLRDEAIRKIRKGDTTVQEMWRVTLEED